MQSITQSQLLSESKTRNRKHCPTLKRFTARKLCKFPEISAALYDFTKWKRDQHLREFNLLEMFATCNTLYPSILIIINVRVCMW